MKAFLSHSTVNKPFVKPIAAELGRQFCVIDEQSFENGQDFKNSIEKGLDESSLFVFFASKDSLQSSWVDFELNEAWFRILQKQITRSLVYILDTSLDHSSLPKWLQKAKIGKNSSPKVIAREIQEQLNEIARGKQQPYFVGRTGDIETMQRLLSPTDGSPPPRAAAIIGLPGIGRRAFIRNTSRTLLNIQRQITIRVQDGDSISDLALKTADQVEPYTSGTGLQKIYEQISRSSDVDNTNRILNDLRLSIANGELPILLDDGGLLDQEGRLVEPVQRILAGLASNDEAYVFLVSSRRPNQTASSKIPVIQLRPLKPEEVKILITLIANPINLHLKANEITELAEYTAGFPPACYYAVQLAKDYGVSVVMGDKFRLVEFRAASFVKYLQEKKLNEEQSKLLALLAEYSPLPLSVIGHSLKLEAESLSKLLVNLIDYCLIYPDDHGLYWIANPIKDAVFRMHKFMSTFQHVEVSKALKSYLDNEITDEPRLELSRVLFKAATYAKDTALASKLLHMANDVIQMAQIKYHDRDYEASVAFGRQAVVLRPQSFNARSYLIRALVQEEHWKEAEDELQKLNTFAAARDIQFLKGFLERKRGNIDEAIRYFNLSVQGGRADVAVKRELAWCYFIKSEFEKSLTQINSILTVAGDNYFIIDLSIQLATKMGDEKTARTRLVQLEAVDSSGFYYHRLSTVESRFGNIPKAYEAAAKAVEIGDRPSFEMLGQLTLCEIKLGHFDRAEELLARMDNDFRRRREDVRINLRCKLELARKKYTTAIALSDKNPNKNDKFFKDVRRNALSGELKHSALDDVTRENYIRELHQIDKDLAAVDADEFEMLY